MNCLSIIIAADLLFQAPMFDNAPKFSLNAGLRGTMPVSDATLITKRNDKMNELIDILEDLEPGSQYIVYQGNIIVIQPDRVR